MKRRTATSTSTVLLWGTLLGSIACATQQKKVEAVASGTCFRGSCGVTPPAKTTKSDKYDADELRELGCFAPKTVCVDVCTAQPVRPNVSLIVAETQPVKIVFIGDDECPAPKDVWCSTSQVANLDVPLAASSGQRSKQSQAEADAKQKKATAEVTAQDLAEKVEKVKELAKEDEPDDAKLSAAVAAASSARAEHDRALAESVEADERAKQLKKEADDSEQSRAKLKRARAAADEAKQRAAQAAEEVKRLQTEYEALPATQEADNVRNAKGSDLARAKQIAEQLAAERERTEAEMKALSKLRYHRDCLVTMPSDPSVRELVVAAKIQQESDNAPPATGNGSTPPPGFVQADRDAKNALVTLTASHGKYYVDVGFLLAYVPDGERTIANEARANIPGDSALAVTLQPKWLPSPVINIYPGGHRRMVLSGFDAKARIWDLLGLQVALNPDVLKDPKLTQLFGGVVFEPITGLGASAGIIGLNGDFFKRGYAEGMSTTAARSDYAREHPMIRWYIGVTMSLELLTTTTRRLQAAQGNPVGSDEEH